MKMFITPYQRDTNQNNNRILPYTSESDLYKNGQKLQVFSDL